MTVLEMLNKIEAMLNHVQVSGKDNLVNLGNAICNLEEVIKALSAPPEIKNNEETNDGDTVDA